ncbi:MAG: cyanophycinase, partial [Candidatus Acidiferrales bacterium]
VVATGLFLSAVAIALAGGNPATSAADRSHDRDLPIAAAAQSPHDGLQVFTLPAARRTTVGQPKFVAVLSGGAGDVDEGMRELCSHANGGEVVVLRASGTDAYNPYFHQLCPNSPVTTLLITSAEGAAEPAAVTHVRQANAIFIAGGDQSNYVKFWPGPLLREINADVARGVPIGGISAGLAVLGQFVYSARHDTITSPEALANPFDVKLTLDRNFIRIPILRGIVTDSHFSERKRMGRTVAFLARIMHDGWAKPARAIGVDQATAVLVDADGKAIVVGKGSAYFLELAHQPERCVAGQALTVTGIKGYKIQGAPITTPAAGFNIKRWAGHGGTAFTINVTNGVMTRTRTGSGQ